MAVLKLKMNARGKDITEDINTNIEVVTDAVFAEKANLHAPIIAITQPDKLILPIINNSEEDIVIRKNKKVGAIKLKPKTSTQDTSQVATIASKEGSST